MLILLKCLLVDNVSVSIYLFTSPSNGKERRLRAWWRVQRENNETRRKPDVSSQHKDQKYCQNWSFMHYAISISLHRSTPRNKPSTTKKLKSLYNICYCFYPCIESCPQRRKSSMTDKLDYIKLPLCKYTSLHVM